MFETAILNLNVASTTKQNYTNFLKTLHNKTGLTEKSFQTKNQAKHVKMQQKIKDEFSANNGLYRNILGTICTCLREVKSAKLIRSVYLTELHLEYYLTPLIVHFVNISFLGKQ
jgi:hypothetical protein